MRFECDGYPVAEPQRLDRRLHRLAVVGTGVDHCRREHVAGSTSYGIEMNVHRQLLGGPGRWASWGRDSSTAAVTSLRNAAALNAGAASE